MPQTVLTTDTMLQVYEARDIGSNVVAQLSEGLEIQLGPSAGYEGREWFEISLEDRALGYVLGPSARSHTTLRSAQPARSLTAVEQALMSIVAEEPGE